MLMKLEETNWGTSMFFFMSRWLFNMCTRTSDSTGTPLIFWVHCTCISAALLPYHCVDGWVEAERCVFGGEGLASRRHQVGVAAAGSVLADVLQRGLATQSRVVRLARRQKMRRLVSRHHLTCVGKDGGGEEAKGVDTWNKNKGESVYDLWGKKRRSERELAFLFYTSYLKFIFF